jgi:protein involved in polysaccharide export with SLBB domain
MDPQSHDAPLLLTNNDEIFIPQNESYVYLSGNVENPGPILYEQGKNARYYIKKAGGFNRKADQSNVVIVDVFGKHLRIKGKSSTVLPGSVIVIPDSIQDKFTTRFLFPLLTTLASTLTVIIALINVSSN